MIVRLNHVSLLVSDCHDSLLFYQQVLDLTTMERPALGFDGAWLKLDHGQSIHLLQLPDSIDQLDIQERPAHAGRDAHVAFDVVDLSVVTARLNQLNIPFTSSRSGRAAIFFRDPDGNGIEVCQA